MNVNEKEIYGLVVDILNTLLEGVGKIPGAKIWDDWLSESLEHYELIKREDVENMLREVIKEVQNV